MPLEDMRIKQAVFAGSAIIEGGCKVVAERKGRLSGSKMAQSPDRLCSTFLFTLLDAFGYGGSQ
jgi:hypothetical protein